jgi:hypothetical protein
VWGVGCVGCGVCGRCGGVGSLLTFDIPQTALVATLDTYDFILIKYYLTYTSRNENLLLKMCIFRRAEWI